MDAHPGRVPRNGSRRTRLVLSGRVLALGRSGVGPGWHWAGLALRGSVGNRGGHGNRDYLQNGCGGWARARQWGGRGSGGWAQVVVERGAAHVERHGEDPIRADSEDEVEHLLFVELPA